MNRLYLLILLLTACSPKSDQEPPPDHWFEVETLASHFDEPQELEILANGDVIFIERGGTVKIYDAQEKEVRVLAKIPVINAQSNGLTGMALDPNFDENGWIYFMYPAIGDTSHLHIARYPYKEKELDQTNKEIVFKIPVDVNLGWHGEDALAFDSKGNLYISLGDFTLQSNDIAGYAQIDERPGKYVHDAQRTSANSQSYPGKILRIHPEEDGTYSIPNGNLFPSDGSKGKPEIYVMGCRNPYRFSIDPITDMLYFGDVGPDAWEDHEKGPRGYDELNIVREAGFYGWPYFVANNKPYRDYDYEKGTLGPLFDAIHPINDSPNNEGIQDLSPAKAAILWYPKGLSSRFPILNQGGNNIMVGPIYQPSLYPASAQKFPNYFAGKLFLYDWVRNWIRIVEIDKQDSVVSIEPFLEGEQFHKIIDMEFGPDGSLYALEYGSLGYRENPDAALRRIVFKEGRPKPLADTTGNHRTDLSLPLVPGYESGKKLIESSNCLSCHLTEGKLIGPGFRDIAMRYWNEDYSTSFLPAKIKEGGSGNWEGNIIMPGNPDLTDREINQMVAYIMTLRYLTLDEQKP